MAITFSNMSRPISTESVFRAIAHPYRRRLIELIGRREWTACDLAAEFHVSQPTISNHLRILNVTGLVHHRRRGGNILYGITPGALKPVAMWLSGLPVSLGVNMTPAASRTKR
jgi:DNA-binding transcriptional ArsR family regulator